MVQMMALCLNKFSQLSRQLCLRIYGKYWEGGKGNSYGD